MTQIGPPLLQERNLRDRILPSPGECSLIKLGGSLLESPVLRKQLAANLTSLAKFPIIVVGGGGLADVVRLWDSIQQLPVADSDYLATRTLSITAELLHRILPASDIAFDLFQATTLLSAGQAPILDVPSVMADPRIPKLPLGWEVTSDSLAAAIAAGWGLRELILIKSTPCLANLSCGKAAEMGLVDRYFPRAVATSLCVRWCDGGQDQWKAEDWLNGEERANDGIVQR